MGEEISKEIAVDGVDVRELYGAQNVYLEQIRRCIRRSKS